MSRLATLCALALTLVLAACASTPRPATPPAAVVVLVSIDGFRPDYLDRGVTPVLSGLAAQGARGTMRPSFPTKTFPNHYTLVTGLRPDHHGIVENTFEDPAIPGVTFKMSNRAAVGEARWWDQATPIWVSAERAGIITAPMFWPGSEAPIRGVRPSLWRPFDQAMPPSARVDQVLAWLDRPPAERPRFVTLYFDDVDTAGHDFGPESAEVNAAAARVDAALGRFTAGLQARGVAANLVIVADHGMAPIAPDRLLYIEDIIPKDAARSLSGGAFMTLYPVKGREAEVEKLLLGRRPHLECWRNADIPTRFRYGMNPRVAPIFCLPETGWSLRNKDYKPRKPERGNHGFDNSSPEMRAVFVASGPAFRGGVTLPTFDNVDVYPLLARLIGVQPESNDGDLDELRAALR
ncbi:ectonucleotide pyrophosphatase/phosphodiesterase [Phenylobacterium sp.]|uniref:alkaline phosphatase family protein n=1 Tax=Phenylobacterium sp. TaxID=1871053 RepID=UPI00286A6B93|nr:ectonucleotide pyrophosphatase/phosphodiesterase [Phenylobacterium sp.]